jgi:hypothetical protein
LQRRLHRDAQGSVHALGRSSGWRRSNRAVEENAQSIREQQRLIEIVIVYL